MGETEEYKKKRFQKSKRLKQHENFKVSLKLYGIVYTPFHFLLN